VISAILLNDVPLDLDTVEYQVQIQHGRADVTANPQPSNAQIVIRGSVGVDVEISDELVVKAYGFHRFTGQVSDVSVTHLSAVPPVAVSTITAIGELSRVGFTEVGASGYPEQTVSQRVEEVLIAVGLPYLNGADSVTVLSAITGGDITPTDALSELASLAERNGGTYFDDPYGRIVFESYGDRGTTTFAGAWSSQIDTWADATTAWNTYPVNMSSTLVPDDGIIFTPTWTKSRQPLVNSVTVLGHNDTHETTQTDSASIAAYGLREYRLNTDIKGAADVIERAGNIITAQANPLWNLGSISIMVQNLDEPTRDKVMALVSGMEVSILNLPQPAPEAQFAGIVEGWGEVFTPGEHILTLSLSDPRFSFETLTWGEVYADIEWQDVFNTARWFEIVSNGSLSAA
jgi:hypothetical protein